MAKRDFALVDSLSGEKTALLDKATGLEWLRLNFTVNRSYERILKEIEPGGEFQTWRLANVGELLFCLRAFHRHGGRHSTDPGIERKLQRRLAARSMKCLIHRLVGISTTGWVGVGRYSVTIETIRFSGDVRDDSGPAATVEISGGLASLSVGKSSLSGSISASGD